MHACIYAYVFLGMHACMHACFACMHVCIYAYVCLGMHVCLCMYIFIYVFMHMVNMHMFMHMFVLVCMHMCMYLRCISMCVRVCYMNYVNFCEEHTRLDFIKIINIKHYSLGILNTCSFKMPCSSSEYISLALFNLKDLRVFGGVF